MTEWWTQQTAALIGGIGGGGLGSLAGILGAAAGMLAPRGKGKALILGSFAVLAAVGAAALITGLIALIQGQPYHVWYPLVLGGVILSAVPGGLFPVLLMRYRQAEARRLEAEELRRT